MVADSEMQKCGLKYVIHILGGQFRLNYSRFHRALELCRYDQHMQSFSEYQELNIYSSYVANYRLEDTSMIYSGKSKPSKRS